MLSRTNTCNGYLEESDSSEFMYNSDNSIINTSNINTIDTSNIDNNDNNEESIGSELSNLSDEVLNEVLLKKYNDRIYKKFWRINDYICALLFLIIITLIISITLFAIYKLTNSKRYLYNYSVIGFFTTLCLSCCLGSCLKYRTEINNK